MEKGFLKTHATDISSANFSFDDICSYLFEFNKFEVFINQILEAFWCYRERLKEETVSSNENRFLSNTKSIQHFLFILWAMNFAVCNNHQILKSFYKLYGESIFFKQSNYTCVSRIIKDIIAKQKNPQSYYLSNKKRERELENNLFLPRSFSLMNSLYNEEKLWL